MLASINGRNVQCSDLGIWDRRMLSCLHPMQIRSYYPDVGRGSIEHRTISHDHAASRLEKCMKKSLLEKLLGWLDV